MWLSSLREHLAAVDVASPELLLDIAVKSAVILALATLATGAMRRFSAAMRHWVWLLGIVSVLVLPVLSAALPGWHILPRLVATHAVPGPADAAAAAPEPIVPAQGSSPGAAPTVQTNALAGSAELGETGEQVPSPTKAAAPVAAAGCAEEDAATREASAAAMLHTPGAAMPWTTWLMLVWLAGGVLVLGHVGLGFLSLRLLQRRCTRVIDDGWSVLLRQLCRMLGIRRPVELLSSGQRTMPMTWGLWRTRLLLPEEAASWSHEQRQAVLLHELAHAKRRDCLTQLAAHVACAMHWFNPLVWFAWRRMQAERERACDDLVLNTGTRASAYAEHVLHSASAMPVRYFGTAAIAMARRSTLEERMRAILNPSCNRRGMSTWGAIGTMLLLGAALLPVAALKAQTSPPHDAATPAIAAVDAPATQPASRLQIRAVLNEGDQGAFDEMADPDDSQRTLRVGRDVLLDDAGISGASMGIDRDGSRKLMFGLKATGAKTLDLWSEANAGRRMAIVLDGKLISAPQAEAGRFNRAGYLMVPSPEQDPRALRPLLDHFNRNNRAAAPRGGVGRPALASPRFADSGGPTSRPAPGRFPRTMTPMKPGEGPTCALDATVYELRVPPEQIGRIDMDALAKAAATPAALEKALADLGAAKPLYRVRQSVRLSGESIVNATQTPWVSSSRTTDRGQVINTVGYDQVGATFDVAGKPVGEGRIELDLSIQVSAVDEGTVVVTPNVKPRLFRVAKIVHKGPADAGRPFVAVSVDAASLDKDGKAVGYVARVTLGAPQPATRPSKSD